MVSFKLFYEASNEHIARIEPAIIDISNRPFKELFGEHDRFIVTTLVPEFKAACESCGIDPLNIPTGKGAFKQLLQRYPHVDRQNLSIIKRYMDQNASTFTMLFSRNPIDVLRMGDFGKMKSCHSVGGIYFNHAVADAKNSGGIVFYISQSDALKIHGRLNDRDIIEDTDRGVKGIVPKGRIRLRKFIDIHTGNDWAVPVLLESYERNGGRSLNYGTPIKFDKLVMQYCQDHQRITRANLSADYIDRNFKMIGGDSSDISPTQMLRRFFNRTDIDLTRAALLSAISSLNYHMSQKFGGSAEMSGGGIILTFTFSLTPENVKIVSRDLLEWHIDPIEFCTRYIATYSKTPIVLIEHAYVRGDKAIVAYDVRFGDSSRESATAAIEDNIRMQSVQDLTNKFNEMIH